MPPSDEGGGFRKAKLGGRENAVFGDVNVISQTFTTPQSRLHEPASLTRGAFHGLVYSLSFPCVKGALVGNLFILSQRYSPEALAAGDTPYAACAHIENAR